MNTRRDLLAGATGLAVAATGGTALAQTAAAAPAEDARLDAILTRQMQEGFARSPEVLTSLGFDRGDQASARWKLNDRSAERVLENRQRSLANLAELKTVDRAKLSRKSAIAYDVALFQGERAAERANYPYTGSPYVVTQQGGVYNGLPDWLDTQHPVRSKDDADAYLSRLNAFGTALDQETARIRADAAAGVVPPSFILDKTLAQLAALRDTAGASSNLAASVDRRARAVGAGDGYGASAAKIVDETVRPAAARQYAALAELRRTATADAGVWKLPNGEAFYASALMGFVTVPTPADEIHQIGLDQVKALQARIDRILRKQGYTKGTVGARLQAISAEPRFLWPNTDEGRAGLLESLNRQMAELEPLLPRVFATLPASKVEIRRVPPTIEIGAPGGYYQRAALDGSRPGAYYINLKDTADWPKWGLPTLTYHEASPGHHFQISVLQEAGELPLYRRLGGFSAFSEGWALYAERVAAEDLGVYADDPFGQIGQLQSYLFRATRLVVDTGLHQKRWTREQAIKWMTDNAAEPAGSAEREIDRYCVNPGQACSYKMGETVISRLRADAEKRLGRKFDLKGFHDAVLLQGAVPLTVLEREVEAWVAARA